MASQEEQNMTGLLREINPQQFKEISLKEIDVNTLKNLLNDLENIYMLDLVIIGHTEEDEDELRSIC